MADLSGFNPSNFEEDQSYDPIPKGTYIATITESEMRQTRAMDGEYLKLTFEITEGPHARRLLWTNLNLRNKNPKAVEIANKNLASICRSVHHLAPIQDSEQLHNKPMKIKVDIRAAQNGYDASNEIKGYAPSTTSAPTTAAPSNGGTAAPPWANQEQKQDGNKPLPF